jgi:hypothetical protein
MGVAAGLKRTENNEKHDNFICVGIDKTRISEKITGKLSEV